MATTQILELLEFYFNLCLLGLRGGGGGGGGAGGVAGVTGHPTVARHAGGRRNVLGTTASSSNPDMVTAQTLHLLELYLNLCLLALVFLCTCNVYV